MMNNNKILTVSYGTFSCTLEGFDDSFGTMKAIAEYFRDLASDDRYFGAEPPQPDAEMLARIAQKEVSRRVEAREQDGKIVLSALENGGVSAPAAALTAAAVAKAPQQEAPEVAETPAAAEAVAEEAPVELATDAVEFVAETVDAADTLVIEDVVNEEPVIEETATEEAVAEEAPEETQVELAEEETSTEADAPIAAEEPAEVEATVEDAPEEDEITAQEDDVFVEDENDIVPGQPDAEVSAFFADATESAEADEIEETLAVEVKPAPEQPAADAPAPDSIAAKLQRIRAVVAQQEETAEAADYLEDEHAEADHGEAEAPVAETPVAEAPLAEAITDIEDALEADDAAEANIDEGDESDDVNAILSRIEARAADTSAQDTVEEDNVDASVEDSVSNLFESEEPEAAPQVTGAPAAPRVSLRKRPVPPVDKTAEEAEESKQNPRARVIKVKRAELQAAIEKGDLEEYEETTETIEAAEEAVSSTPSLDDLAPARRKETALSPEDQEDLARELAELEEDISATATTPEADETARPLRRPEPVRNVLPAIEETDETDVNRLLAETDQQMDEPESATRRDAFAHLRAAVAAKKADVSMGSDAQADAEVDAYRNDLAEVVRPRRPAAATTRTDRPVEAEPAPLKLVAEQRIDVAREAGPVRPRRVAADMEETTAMDGESFSEFASEMGAATLPQLLEAAAAYMSFVEGRAQFSRPQLMTKVRQAGGNEEFSREEGLRSFGQLLRAGKIEKIKGGRFTVSDDIGYRPDERAAG